jgi:hypothetical protein
MTDRELLELAAKAAGMEYSDLQWSEYDEEYVTWNPLVDDGDALRLAVKLQFKIDLGFKSVAIRHSVGIKILEAFTDDPYAATSRAIVRASAEIGRNMK